MKRGDRSELELVAGEREGRGCVAVGVVAGHLGHPADAEPDPLHDRGARGLALLDGVEDAPVSRSPRKTVMMAGGASFAPRR
jgi:hypothetical protein